MWDGLTLGLHSAPASLSNPSRIRSVVLKDVFGSSRSFLTNITAGLIKGNFPLSSSTSKVPIYLLNEVSVMGKGLERSFRFMYLE